MAQRAFCVSMRLRVFALWLKCRGVGPYSLNLGAAAVNFIGFSLADFAAYEEKKWASNVYTLERMKVKEKLKALIQDILQENPDLGTAISWAYSDEYPAIANNKQVDSQLAYAIRDERDCQSLRRFLEKTKLNADEIFSFASYFKHLAIVVSLTLEGVAVKLSLQQDASIDRANLAARLGKTWDQGICFERFKALPAGYFFKLNGADIDPLLDADSASKLAKALDEPALLELGWFDSSEVVIGQGADYMAVVRERLAALLPIYRFAAWSHDNDHINVDVALIKVRKAAKTAQNGLSRGSKIKLTGGLFAGREGQIIELDGRGGAKVSIGGLAINVAISDCKPL